MTSKLTGLIDYLSELAQINSSVVRCHEDYHKVLWTYEIPHEPKHCFTRAWGSDENYGDDIWIEVKKFPEPKVPTVPKICEKWVEIAALHDLDEFPVLRAQIVEMIETKTAEGIIETVQETRKLGDLPAVQKAWDDYVERHWMPWTDIYRRHHAVQKVYAELFSIHLEQLKLGEQYELVFCLGLLNWKQPNGHSVKRHLVVAKASLEFEPGIGRFTVKAAADGDQTEVEFDMLDVDAKPHNQNSLEGMGKNIRDNLWERNDLDALLKAIANSLADKGQGQYDNQALKPGGAPATDTPIVEFAPALILRKRSVRGLLKILEDMKQQVAKGVEPPREFLDLCESLRDKNEEYGEQGSKAVPPSSEIYFPLPANEQQLQIIRKLDARSGVLVQGPPGTGKSHTIANLICHLLATGQRVLVTAKTARALEVLYEKIPAAVRPLCINLSGSGTEEKKSLEASVTGILNGVDRRDDARSAKRITDTEQRLRNNRATKAECDNKIFALRERETYQHIVAGGAFCGTAAAIAERLRKEAESYNWFADHVGEADEIPLSSNEIKDLSRLLSVIDKETETDLDHYLPDSTNNVPECEKLRTVFRREKECHGYLKYSMNRINTQEGKVLSRATREHVTRLHEILEKLIAETGNVGRRPMTWVAGAVVEVLTDFDTPWKELLRLSLERTYGLKQAAGKVQYYTVHIPDNMDHKKLSADAEALKCHFENGGKIKEYVFFTPKVIKNHGDMINRVKVDGQDCTEPATLQKLIEYLNAEQKLNEVWILWKGKAARSSAQFLIQLAEIDELHEALQSVVGLYELRGQVLLAIRNISGLSNPHFEDATSLTNLASTCQVVLAMMGFAALKKQLDIEEAKLNSMAVRGDTHPVCIEILSSFQERNIDKYCKAIEKLSDLQKQFAAVKSKRAYIGRLVGKAPKLAGHLSGDDRQIWIERLNNLEKAWAWRRAGSWLTQYLQMDSESLERERCRLGEEIKKDIAALASEKAWSFCFSRMTQTYQRHLESWQYNINKLGKGTGKHAHTHRLNAQRDLNKCKEAVPAWIMPLHRVYETVEAGSEIFDVIIVDEASQCGPESLPLMYLTRKIIVVGDDKQISPEAVGVDRSQVQGLMRNYLPDFVFGNTFDVDNSLFEHGKIRFGNRITLREHFRCMPEIIRFSNELCYTSNPLIPLRQYPPDRLEPLKAVYVQNGHREGSLQRVINRPEAEALATKLVECCRDERYQGMTMGVIILQGEAQAGIIEALLLKEIGAEEMQKRKIICGNPYHFQGDERDIIFLSMVAATNERIGAFTQAPDMRRFNVAASRAREQMWLFHSVTVNDLSSQCYRRKLINHFYGGGVQTIDGVNVDALRESAFNANRMQEHSPSPFDSWFEVDVALAIASRGYRVVPQFEFAGKYIDLVVQGDKPQIAVECDGDIWHGRDEYENDMKRQRILERCGWHFFRLRASHYYAAPEKALEPLWLRLEKMGISPENQKYVPANEQLEREEAQEKLIIDEEEEKDSDGYVDDMKETVRHIEQLTLPVIDESSHEKKMKPTSALPGEMPVNVQEAMTLKPKRICRMIIDVLKTRSNSSCIRENMPTYILKEWNLRTRGNPRDAFAKKVDDQIAIMIRKGYLIAYKSVNNRIKIGWNTYSDED